MVACLVKVGDCLGRRKSCGNIASPSGRRHFVLCKVVEENKTSSAFYTTGLFFPFSGQAEAFTESKSNTTHQFTDIDVVPDNGRNGR